MNNRVRGARPLWEGGNVVAEGGVVDLVDKNTEEGSGLVVWVRLELRVKFDDECGGDGGEQTGLRPSLVRVDQNLAQNSRRSMSCSGPHHISLWSPYHTPRPPCDSVRKTEPDDPRW